MSIERQSTVILYFSIAVIVAIVGFVLTAIVYETGQIVLGDIVGGLLFGWLIFLIQNLSQAELNFGGMLTYLLSLVIFTSALHFFASRAIAHVSEQQWKWKHTLLCTLMIVVAFIAGFSVVGLTKITIWSTQDDRSWTSMQGAPSPERRNLKTLGVVILKFADARDEFPSYSSQENPERATHSWQTHLLPYLGQGPLFEQINQELSWDHPDNRPAFMKVIPEFVSSSITSAPIDSKSGYAVTDYSANARLFATPERWSPESLSQHDGTSYTVMAGQIKENLPPWGKPDNWRDPALGINKSPQGFGSSQKGAYVLMADGAVQWLGEKIDPDVLKALSTPDGGETLDSLEEWE